MFKVNMFAPGAIGYNAVLPTVMRSGNLKKPDGGIAGLDRDLEIRPGRQIPGMDTCTLQAMTD